MMFQNMKLVLLILIEIVFIRNIKTSTLSNHYDCSDINFQSNEIFHNHLCGDLIFNTDFVYSEKHLQWASLRDPENISPEIILIPECDGDIELITKYAKQCDYKIMTRSGGHQYR